MEGKGISGGVAEVKEKFLTVYMVGENNALLENLKLSWGQPFSKVRLPPPNCD